MVGHENASDLATRGISASALTETSEWFNGPRWLQLLEERQPISRLRESPSDTVLPKEELRHTAAPAIVAACELPLNLALYGSASHAVRVLANVLRFV